MTSLLPHVGGLDKRQTLFGLDSHCSIGETPVSLVAIRHLVYLSLLR